MADTPTGLGVKSLSGEFILGKLVDTGGTNVAAVSAAGRLSVDASGVAIPVTDNAGSLTVDAPVGTPIYVRLSDGAANLIGQKAMSASLPVVLASDQSSIPVTGTFWQATQPVSIAATVTVDTELPAAGALADATTNPTVPAVGSFLVGFNGTTWDRVRTANTGRLQVDVVTGASGGTQYVGDAAATSTPTGTITMGLGNAAAPTDVSANNDAVAVWALRNGSQVVNLASGGTLVTLGQKVMASSLPVTLASDQSALAVSGTFWQATQPVSIAATVTVDTELPAAGALADAASNPTTALIGSTELVFNGTTWDRRREPTADGMAVTGLAAGALMGYNGTTWDRVRTANTGRLQVDIVTGGGASTLVDNAAFTDGTTPVSPIGFIFDDVAGTALTENDVAAARVDSKRAVVFVGEDATTRTQKWAISAAGALSSNITQVGGATHSATVPLFTRLTDGTAVYSKTGQTAGTASFVQISDQTNAAAVIATILSLKVDASSIAGAVPSATNALPVRLTDGAAFYASASGAPTAPVISTVTSSALGAGASVDLDHTTIANGTTGQLMGIDAASTVPLKIEIQSVDGSSVATTRVVLFAPTYSGVQWRAPYKTFLTRAGAAANTKFRTKVTNKDASVAADVYSTAYFDVV